MKDNGKLIVEALNPFDIPIYYNEVPEDALDKMEYIYYRETQLNRSTVATFTQHFEVAYISQYKDSLKEEQFINAIEKKGFLYQTGLYERLKLGQTTGVIDIFIMTFTKPVKRSKCVRG